MFRFNVELNTNCISFSEINRFNENKRFCCIDFDVICQYLVTLIISINNIQKYKQ